MAEYSTGNKIPKLLHSNVRPWREIAAIALLLMDISWLIAWHASIFQPAERLSKASFYLLYGSMVAACYVLTYLFHWLQLRTNIRRAALLLILFGGYVVFLDRFLYVNEQFSLLLIIRNVQVSFVDSASFLPPEFSILALCTYLVFRSARLVSRWIGQSVVRKNFQLGISLLLMLGAISSFLNKIDITLELLVFLISSLVALGAARVSTLPALRGGGGQKLDLPSILSVSSSAVLIALLGFVLGDLASINLSSPTAIIFLGGIRLLLVLIIVALSPIVLLISLFVTWLGEILGEAPILQAIELEIVRLFDVLSSLIESILTFMQGVNFRIPDISWLRPYILWGTVVFILFMLLREFGRRDFSISKMRAVFDEQRTSLTEKSFRTWLKNLFDDQVAQISGRINILNQRRLLGAIRIRRIYAKLMKMCEGLDVPRASTVTPLEYLDELELLFSEKRAQVRTITQAYNRVRYGELPETPDEVRVVEKAWSEVRQSAKDLQSVRRQIAKGATLE